VVVTVVADTEAVAVKDLEEEDSEVDMEAVGSVVEDSGAEKGSAEVAVLEADMEVEAEADMEVEAEAVTAVVAEEAEAGSGRR
jgi:hypothetical protein